MTMRLDGSCRCGSLRFSVESHTPVPYQLCYCSICRKQQGGGGHAINLGALSATLTIQGRDSLGIYRAEIVRETGHGIASTAERSFCRGCGSGLWLYDPTWPELIHPFASAIDTDLPVPPERTHIMLAFRPAWVEPVIRPGDKTFDHYPDESIVDWHRRTGMWVD